jgi:L-fuconolactonase
VLGDSTRRAIFERLARGPCSVGELAEELPVTRPAVSQHLRVLKDAGLVFDLLVRTAELPAAIETVHRHPDTRFVLDHLAKPPVREGDTDMWARSVAALADAPNVTCKLSAIVTEADWSAWRSAGLAEYFRRTLGWFGAERCMFGSDWPVCLLAATYAQVVDATRELLGDLSAAERRMIFGGTAAKTYALEVAQAVGEPYGLGEPSRPDTA